MPSNGKWFTNQERPLGRVWAEHHFQALTSSILSESFFILDKILSAPKTTPRKSGVTSLLWQVAEPSFKDQDPSAGPRPLLRPPSLAVGRRHSPKIGRGPTCTVAQPCPTLRNLMGCSTLGSSVHRTVQARILLWVAIPFSRGSSQTRDQARVSASPALEGALFTPVLPGKPQRTHRPIRSHIHEAKSRAFVVKWTLIQIPAAALKQSLSFCTWVSYIWFTGRRSTGIGKFM